MFIDTAKIDLRAGSGGDGCTSYECDQAGKKMRSNGGPGGRGGDIYFVADVNVRTLLDFQYLRHFEAKNGGNGSSNNKKGASGGDLYIKIPTGTVVKDYKTDRVMADLVRQGEKFLACKGGKGGSGNSRMRPAAEGEPGEEKRVILELKLIADVGIVGYPNAGKSTLISKVTKAHPKIADYPFTTKEPNLGVARVNEFDFVIADIPGLIEGAHEGRGLGDKFLRHIERTKIIIHLIDMSGFSQRDPLQDYKLLNNELEQYSKELAKKPQIIAANKMDMRQEAEANLKRFKKSVKRKKVVPISALNNEGLKELMAEVIRVLKAGA